MKDENTTIESMIKGGLIGAALGAFLSKDKEDGALLGAILGSAISATFEANKEAHKTNVPFYVEEGGKLYLVNTTRGQKQFIKNIKRNPVQFPEKFKLR